MMRRLLVVTATLTILVGVSDLAERAPDTATAVSPQVTPPAIEQIPDPAALAPALREGDTVPMTVFPAPTPRSRLPLPVQEHRVARQHTSYLTIPRLGATLPLSPASVVEGHMQVPGGDVVGWLDVSAKPGSSRGVSVLAGHLTDGPQGADAGPLYGAEELAPGSRIRVTWEGKTTTYRVTHVTKHPRHDLPPELLDPNGAHRLALTVCTGPYVMGADGRLWLSRNAVIWAEPVT